jgi:regulator of sirC expression with transglutaminase-like and TPR domain
LSETSNIPALIKLLDEPDETAFGLIRNQIFSIGPDALAPLEKALENTFDNLVQERIQEIIRKLNQENLYVDFVNWLNLGSDDLLKGFVLVTKTQYPALDEEEIRITVEQLKMDVWIELHENLTALENVKVLNHVLYDLHHFDGNKSDMNAPQNSYVNTFLETHKGSPLSLGILFIILAQKLGMPVYGVNLPQHFILAYLTDSGLKNAGEDDVLFYINPFNKGAVFTRREIELFIREMRLNPERSFFAPCSNPDIIRRLIHSLINSYNQYGYPDKIEELENLLNAFE